MRRPGHRFDPSILREYDIRGVLGETLGAADAHALGQAFGQYVMAREGRRVALGYDGRHSSPELEAAVCRGLVEAGVAVERIGCGPTPMLYFAVHQLPADAGLMVTGSHNPPDHNGFKLVFGTEAVFGPAIQELGRVAEGGIEEVAAATRRDTSVFAAYVERLLRDYAGRRPLRVAWDAGNGATGDVMSALTARLPGEHILLNEHINGSFPAHHPDPAVAKNLEQLQETVRQRRCDLGFAFDGDGDRLGVVDGDGGIVWGDQLIALLARDVLARAPGATIIADVKSSEVVFDEIARLGGAPLMWKSGHALLRSKLAETGSPFAGELSGHLFFGAPFYGHDDALYAALRFLELAANSDDSVAALHRSLPQRESTPELRFPCDDASKFQKVEEVRRLVRRSGAAVNDIDGVRVSTADGWWLLRASNTQAVLVARCEARDRAGLERVESALRETLAAAGLSLPEVA